MSRIRKVRWLAWQHVKTTAMDHIHGLDDLQVKSLDGHLS